jgi:beta-lactamase class D
MKPNWIICAFLHLFCGCLMSEENFILINGTSNEKVLEIGSHLDERVTPFSTFKIALSLMGFDSGILVDESMPIWLFQEGYDDFLESWKSPQTPRSWLKNCCVWYSRILASKLGLENFQVYLEAFNYGNQDVSGGLTGAWLGSSLKISPREQVLFIEKIINETLPISTDAAQMTKSLLFREELSNGWKLFGQTGGGSIDGPDGKSALGCFVGWIEKDNRFFLFAYNIRDVKIDFSKRVSRVKQLLEDSNVMNF